MVLALLVLMAFPDAMTPSNFVCTSGEAKTFSGRVMRYERSRAKTVIRIRTDARTFEEVTIQHPKSGDPSSSYLINQQPFTRNDWRRVEARKGMLWPAMRAHVSMCASGEVLVDWRPDESAIAVK